MNIAATNRPVLLSSGVVTVNLIDSQLLLTDSLLSIADSGLVRLSCAAVNLDDGIALLKRFRPQAVLVSGEILIEGLRILSEEMAIRLGETRLGVFADRLTDSQLAHAATNHVNGFFSKLVPREDLLDGIMQMAQGAFFVAEPLKARVQTASGSQPRFPTRERLALLTDRQLEVLIQLASGDSVRDIATRLHLSEKAVESHKFRIMNRLGISNRVQLCRWAIREGLISP